MKTRGWNTNIGALVVSCFNRDRRELYHKLGSELERDLNNKLRHQVHKLDDIMDEVENAQNKIRDKVERQVPKDVRTN